jgi:hypothetical protein
MNETCYLCDGPLDVCFEVTIEILKAPPFVRRVCGECLNRCLLQSTPEIRVTTNEEDMR